MLRAQQALDQPLVLGPFLCAPRPCPAIRIRSRSREASTIRASITSPPSDLEKVWWSQAELLAALSVEPGASTGATADVVACEKLLAFLQRQMIDPQDGIWVASVSPDGQPKWDSKKNHWKANYHDVRGIVMFVEAMKKQAK